MVAHIQEANRKELKAIDTLTDRWEDDALPWTLKQKEIIKPERGSLWRIDRQENGRIVKTQYHGWSFHSVAIQRGTGRNNVFANVFIPACFQIGACNIRAAFAYSQKMQRTIAITIDKADDYRRIATLGPQNCKKAEEAEWTLGLAWVFRDMSLSDLPTHISTLGPSYRLALASIASLSKVTDQDVEKWRQQLLEYTMVYNHLHLPAGLKLLRKCSTAFSSYLLLSADEFQASAFTILSETQGFLPTVNDLINIHTTLTLDVDKLKEVTEPLLDNLRSKYGDAVTTCAFSAATTTVTGVSTGALAVGGLALCEAITGPVGMVIGCATVIAAAGGVGMTGLLGAVTISCAVDIVRAIAETRAAEQHLINAVTSFMATVNHLAVHYKEMVAELEQAVESADGVVLDGSCVLHYRRYRQCAFDLVNVCKRTSADLRELQVDVANRTESVDIVTKWKRRNDSKRRIDSSIFD